MPVEPTEEQIQAATTALEAHGCRLSSGYGRRFRDDAWETWHLVQLNHVCDENLRALPAVPFSFELDLSRSRISDAGIEHLARFEHLESLNVSDTGVRPGSKGTSVARHCS
jgi:hypothetical protein